MIKIEQEFGGPWTLIKLEIIEKYLNAYTKALSKKFKLCYIDAFAGSGYFNIKKGTKYIAKGTKIEGSALRALDYNFDKYVFIDINKEYLNILKKSVENKDLNFIKDNKVIYKDGDCNEILKEVSVYDWKRKGYRGIIFLDPYKTDLSWETLEKIAKTEIFDVWYLFPISDLNRKLCKNGKICNSNIERINKILGTNKWENIIYEENLQLNLLNEVQRYKISIENLEDYIVKRLKSLFPAVADNPKSLVNSNNVTIFLLCFASSNPSPASIKLALKIASNILKTK